jgi:formylglycine-generating enzyme required for sulfatase activity
MQRALLVPHPTLAALAAVLAAACSDPNLGAQSFRCDRDDDCGPGWRCVAGLCAAPGTHADVGSADVGGADAGLTWVPFGGGTFEMGCSVGDAACASDEQPRHAVTVRSFAILETEVTEAQYAALMDGAQPSRDYGGGGGEDSPVENVNWHTAGTFCQRAGGRLCSEAEWEYAARGGTTTVYACGDDASCLDGFAWYSANSGGHKRDVRTAGAPNSYGLFDMYGNVWEWVEDDWHGGYDGAPDNGRPWVDEPRAAARVRRGGSFFSTADYLCASSRGAGDPAYSGFYVGLRCCRSVD